MAVVRAAMVRWRNPGGGHPIPGTDTGSTALV